MKERPINSSAPMMRAILDGRKTQTRLVVKRQDEVKQTSDGIELWTGFIGWQPMSESVSLCPYGIPGDRLWVRETWWQGQGPTWGEHCVVYDVDKAISWDLGSGFDNPNLREFRERSPSFMPRWASRITLEITGARVERLQAITDQDAQAEGIRELPLQEGQPGAWWAADPTRPKLHGRSPVDAYAKLWGSIQGAYSWDTNPWVWVIEFKKVETVE